MCPECVNSYCSHDRCISPYISHVIGSTYCHVSQYVLPYIAHVVRVAHHMLPMWSCVSAYRAMWSEWLTIYFPCVPVCLTIYCPCGRVYQHTVPCGQSVSAYRAMWSECITILCYVARVCHDTLYQFTRSAFSICLTTCCPCGHGITIPCYVVGVSHSMLHWFMLSLMVSMYRHILPMCPKCVS